jgi:hypothetical protein
LTYAINEHFDVGLNRSAWAGYSNSTKKARIVKERNIDRVVIEDHGWKFSPGLVSFALQAVDEDDEPVCDFIRLGMPVQLRAGEVCFLECRLMQPINQ